MVTIINFLFFFSILKEIPIFPGIDCPHELETIKSFEKMSVWINK